MNPRPVFNNIGDVSISESSPQRLFISGIDSF